ncbi:hypothetical protein [Achromobacter aloeverae]
MAGNWFVVLHQDSDAAAVLGSYQAWEFEGHPALECSRVDWTNTHYLGLRLTPMPGHPKSDYQAWIPHHAVVTVLRAAADQTTPIGFVRSDLPTQ